MKHRINKLVQELNLLPHPEGGFFKETYRSKGIITKNNLSPAFSGERNYCTSIYFLLTSENFSAFHRIQQDEIWHFYEGSPLHVHVIDKKGKYTKYDLGLDLEKGQAPQLVVPAGCWFGSSVKDLESFSFVGCTVAPGFDFNDFELAERNSLLNEYPEHQDIITQLTR
jgi:hypothetical protein